MSVVTSVVILASIMEEETTADGAEGATLAAINTFFGDGARMREISEDAGGNKAVQATIFAGAFNFLDDDAFIAHLRTVPWNMPEAVRVFVNGEHDSGWTEIQPVIATRT